MPRRTRRLAPLALVAAAALAGCQDYNFSPVDYCLIQPGTERVTLSEISTADILFVVDDSGSMGGEQQKLAANFSAFVGNLTATNGNRVGAGLEPIDFHIAITTTSIFINEPVAGVGTCRTGCGTASGQVCCTGFNTPVTAPKTCSVSADCSATANAGCWTDCVNHAGQSFCCDNTTKQVVMVPAACTVAGAECGDLRDRYLYNHGARTCTPTGLECRDATWSCVSNCAGAPGPGNYCCKGGATDPLSCNPGVADTLGNGSSGEFTLFPKGDFVKAATSASGPPPRVIHFDKSIFSPVAQANEINIRSDWFKANVQVGTCGSGEEQGMQAARLAVQKALHQNGLSQPAGVLPAEWPHDKSKLVLVWIGDEDDCSSPEDSTKGVVMSLSGDACVADGALPAAQQKRFKVSDIADYFASLGRPMAGGFIVSAVTETCQDAACQPGVCCDYACTGSATCSTQTCGGQGSGFRFIELSQNFSGRGADVVVGSVCNPAFSTILDRVAEVVKQPAGLQLPTQPASASLTVLRIVASDGTKVKTCSAPAPVGTTGTGLDAYDWWFTDGNDLNSRVPTTASRFITINHDTQRCEANPGQTYSADYLGLVPAMGVDGLSGCADDAQCDAALGPLKAPAHWTCAFDPDLVGPPPPGARGSCICQ
jgi:hypothetical protein